MVVDVDTPVQTQQRRRLIHKSEGKKSGPNGALTRLASPSDLGKLIKPFILLDYAFLQLEGVAKLPLHPHSGIATLTVVIEGVLHLQDIEGSPRTLPAGGVEWIRAGGGVWHGGPISGAGEVKLFQLWMALPPHLESIEPDELFLEPEDIPAVGPACVLLGQLDGKSSREGSGLPLNYLHVRLASGERWRYQPPQGHDVLWIAVYSGSVDVGEPVLQGELAVFEPSEHGVDFVAGEACGFVLGSAVKSPSDLAEGYYSVHTNSDDLQRGEAEILRLGELMREQGRLPAEQLAKVTRQMAEAHVPATRTVAPSS